MQIKSDLATDFFTLGDSLLLDSGYPIADFAVEHNGKKYDVIIEPQGEVRISDSEEDETYRYPIDFPDELIQGLENDDLDERFEIENSNWYEVMLFEGDNLIHSDVMDCYPRDFKSISELEDYIAEIVSDWTE